ncbi:hypothetical protein BO94DRAFT_532845 [Aspergillus sclerotioniger CBS 115572]|uniref:TPR-like protein n=1 Tax=Aspergillus sclerotioniger CBS 115572 TaxID=1450535 RepID=A0A317X346_9EURO|nr:hypothetical protein BO94DRAFT_532845 [Aspergillus sclerotioniger CBS 115572]PWY93049.1 hypothetical protein BO94DRAFT_532845 [Aspergillus sclerotioniger CBS 115572]
MPMPSSKPPQLPHLSNPSSKPCRHASPPLIPALITPPSTTPTATPCRLSMPASPTISTPSPYTSTPKCTQPNAKCSTSNPAFPLPPPPSTPSNTSSPPHSLTTPRAPPTPASTPSTALRAADLLRDLVPDAGHLHHMPTHLDILVGDYRRAIASNTAAVHADNKYLALHGAKNMYSFYRLHDYHSLIYAAMLSGQRQIALQALDPMESTLTEDILTTQSPPLADWLEFFKSVRVHVYIRFGMWDEIIALPLPPAEKQDLYCVTTAMTYYGKGIAYAATRNLTDADIQRELYLAAANRVPESRRDYPNRIVDVMKVATAMLNGEIEYRRDNFDVAFEHLRQAVREDDALLYTEPWGWMVPTRHAYGALLLEQGHVEEAARAYAEDLGIEDRLTRAHQHPGTVWALHGYYECLERLGRHAEARIIKQQLDVAVGVADVHFLVV